MDRCIDRGISDKELQDCINKGARRKKIILGRNLSKHFIKYRYYEIVCLCRPCQRYVKTIQY